MARRKRTHHNETPYVQSVEDFLQSGGTITQCPSRAAMIFAPGTARVDGISLGLTRWSHETIPSHLLTLETYDAAQYEPDHAVEADMWQEFETEHRDSLVPHDQQDTYEIGREDEEMLHVD